MPQYLQEGFFLMSSLANTGVEKRKPANTAMAKKIDFFITPPILILTLK
jgi:hypothetical protein